MLNTKNIELAMKKANISKVSLCESINIARTTFDAILNGGDTHVSTLEAIASVLKVPIGYLFDEISNSQITVEANNHSVAAIENININDYKELNSKVKYLEELIAEKDKIIRLYERLQEKLNN